MRPGLRKAGRFNAPALLRVTVLLLLIFGVYLLSWWVDFGAIVQPERIVGYLRAAGPLAPVVFLFLMVTTVVISPIPSWPLDVAAGIAFGGVLGTLYAVIGAEIGALLSFLLARLLGRDLITRLARADLILCERCSDRYLVIFVFVSRLFPIFSFGLVSYGAGLTKMSLWAFALATLFGMIPPTFALVSLGESLFFGEWPLLLFGIVMVAFFFIVPKLMSSFRSVRWVQLLMKETAAEKSQVPQPGGAADLSARRCPACGGLIE